MGSVRDKRQSKTESGTTSTNSSSESVVQEEPWQSTQHPSFSALLPAALPSSQQSGEQHRQLRPKKREHGVRGQRSRRPSPSTDGTPKSLETSPGWRSTRWTSTTAAPWCWTPSSRSRMRWTPALLSGGAESLLCKLWHCLWHIPQQHC